MPWAACNGATDWQIHLNPSVRFDITARSNGGNFKLDLAGMAVSRVAADTGGGNIEVVLPENAAGLNVKASTGAGNVVVHMPSGMAAKVYATSGLGTVTVDFRFTKIDGNTYAQWLAGLVRGVGDTVGFAWGEHPFGALARRGRPPRRAGQDMRS